MNDPITFEAHHGCVHIRITMTPEAYAKAMSMKIGSGDVLARCVHGTLWLLPNGNPIIQYGCRIEFEFTIRKTYKYHIYRNGDWIECITKLLQPLGATHFAASVKQIPSQSQHPIKEYPSQSR